MDVAKKFTGSSKIKLRVQQKRRRRLREVAAPPYMVVSKNSNGSSKILLWLQQKYHCRPREVAALPDGCSKKLRW